METGSGYCGSMEVVRNGGEPRPPPPAAHLPIGRRIAVVIGTGLGAGYAPVAPGTVGTLFPGLPLAWWLAGEGLWVLLASGAILFAAGVWAAGKCEEVFARRDPPRVVIDEVLGLLTALAGVDPTWQALLGAFLLFRTFDILKPWPVGLIDRRVPGGLGVVLDDVVAGLYSRALLEIGLRALS